MKHQKRVFYLTHSKRPALVHGILTMPRPSSVGGGLMGLFLLTWVSLWSQVAQAGTIFNQPGPFTGAPIAITTFADSDALDLAVTDFTMSACVYLTYRNPGFSSAILTKRGATNGWALLLNGESGDGPTGTVKFRTGGLVRSSQTLSLNTWYHVAVVYQAGQAQIFMNGALDGTKAIPHPQASEKVLRVGGDFDYTKVTNQFRWNGTLSNLQIDDTAFSQAQIQTLCKSCNGVNSCGTPTPPCQCPDPNNPFAACPSTCPTPGATGATYTSGVIHIPQLSISGSNQTCEVYLLQQPSSFNFSLDVGRLICK